MAEMTAEQKELERQAGLVAKALSAHGIADKHVFGKSVVGELVTIVTNGGSRVKWSPGAKDMVKLTEKAITGIADPRPKKGKK